MAAVIMLCSCEAGDSSLRAGSAETHSSLPAPEPLSAPAAVDGSGAAYESIPTAQKQVPYIETMPNMPAGYKLIDYKKRAVDFDNIAFDYDRQGKYLPLILKDTRHYNTDFECSMLYAYVGKGLLSPGAQESIVYLPAVLSGALMGINKSKQHEKDFVRMTQTYYQKTAEEYIITSSPRQLTGTCNFWMMVYPTLDFLALTELYPDVPDMVEISKTTVEEWYKMLVEMREKYGDVIFDVVGFNFTTRELILQLPGATVKWTEPEVAAGVAAMMIYGHKLTGDKKYLESADWCMEYLNKRPEAMNPFYEILLTYAPVVTARLRTQYGIGKGYDLEKFFNWIFSIGPAARDYYGISTGTFGGVPSDGLCFQYNPKSNKFDMTTEEGKASTYRSILWTMNSITFPSILAPTARYDQSYARALGKYTLNAAANCRYFYGDNMPEDKQTNTEWQHEYDKEFALPYENMEYVYEGKTPCLTGDPMNFKWGQTNLSLYSGAAAGKLGALVNATNIEGVLQLDLLKTDYFKSDAYQTYLYYNPHNEAKNVGIMIDEDCDLYDAVSDMYLGTKVKGYVSFSIPADSAMVVVVAPAGSKRSVKDGNVYIDGVFAAGGKE